MDTVSWSPDTEVGRHILVSSSAILSGDSEIPMLEFTFLAETVSVLELSLG